MLDSFEFLPWQIKQAKQWLGNKERFAHAWLIYGMPGIGQEQFSLAAARSLLCEAPQAGIACGECSACNWVNAGNHPDLRRIRSELRMRNEGFDTPDNKKQASKEIKIEQIRSLQPWFNTATHRGGLRVALLYMAEDLNPMAANAVLKILEEPPANTVFLLAANSPDSLLPTIVSRCRRIVLAKPSSDVAIKWLADQGIKDAATRLISQGGAPLSAYYQAADEPIPAWLIKLIDMLYSKQLNAGDLADLLANQTNVQWIDTSQRLWLDFMLCYFDLQAYYYPDMDNKIRAIAKRANINHLLQMEKWLAEIKPLANHPLNAKLLTDTAANKLLLSVSS